MNKEEQVLAEFWDLFNKKIWLDAYKMKESLKEYKPSEIHCIEYIGKSEDSNVTKLAETFYMTRSAISKITKKLIAIRSRITRKKFILGLRNKGMQFTKSMRNCTKSSRIGIRQYLNIYRKSN